MTDLKELVKKPEPAVEDYLLTVEIQDFIKDVEALIPKFIKDRADLEKLGNIDDITPI